MASIIDSFFGQQDAPDLKSLSVQDILGAIQSSLPQLAKINDKFDMDRSTGGAKAQVAGEKIYDPNRGAIRSASGAELLRQVNDPFGVDSRLASLWRQQGLESAFGGESVPSNNAIQDMFSSFGAKAQDRADNILKTGLGYGANTANLYNPQAAVTPGDAGSMFSNQNTQQNAINKYLSDLNFQNSMNLINRPLEIGGKVGNIAGQIAGGVMGTNMGGGMMGAMGGGGGGGGANAATLSYAAPNWASRGEINSGTFSGW